MKWWYEFWITYFDQKDEVEVVDHGVMNATSVVELVEVLSGYYGDDCIYGLDLRFINISEDAPLLFDRGCEPNRARYWKKDELERVYN